MIDPNLREQLLAFETETPSLKEKYQKEIQAMLEKELTPPMKIELYAEILIGVLTLVGGLIGVVATLFIGKSSFFFVCILLLIALLGLACTIHGAWTLYLGKVYIKNDRQVEMTVLWTLGGSIVFLFMLAGACNPNPAEGSLKVLFGYPTLFILVLATLHRYIEKTGFEMKEHLLRLELQIAELNSKIQSKIGEEKKE